MTKHCCPNPVNRKCIKPRLVCTPNTENGCNVIRPGTECRPEPNCRPVDSVMRIKNDNCKYMRFNLASSVFGPSFDRKPISTVCVTNNLNGSIDIDTIFIVDGSTLLPRPSCQPNGQCQIVDSDLWVKSNTVCSLSLTLGSCVFNETFNSKTICAVELFHNFNCSVDIKLIFK